MHYVHLIIDKMHIVHYIDFIGSERPVPTIHTIGAVQIKIYFNEHGAPHFHVVAAGRDAKILIDAEATVLDSGLTRIFHEAA